MAPKKPKVVVTKESDSGRNQKFLDRETNEEMTRAKFVKSIEEGKYPEYHIRNINNIKTPVSNPDGSSSNNLD